VTNYLNIILGRKPLPGKQLVSGNKGEIKDVGKDRIREGIISTANFEPPARALGAPIPPSSPISPFDLFPDKKHTHPELARPYPDSGKRGMDGFNGPPGVAGPTGPAGAVGPQGPAGPPGMDGRRGMDGLPGTPGPAGPAGAVGPVGPQAPSAAGRPLTVLPMPTMPFDPLSVGPIGPQGPPGVPAVVVPLNFAWGVESTTPPIFTPDLPIFS
jgi:hypothetical protein